MKNYIRATALGSLLLLATACVKGPVEDKRAPGMPGEKTFELLVDSRWVEVSVQEWDKCKIDAPYPDCLSQPGAEQP